MTDGLSAEERLYFALKNLYRGYGYGQYRMRKFEEYSLYSENINFLKSKEVITFNDHGRLLALKPDVTLSIVKNSMPPRGECRKLYYRESVYRPDSNSRFTEISQIGLEYLGKIDGYACLEVLALAAESLKAVGGGFVIDISHMGVIDGIMAACGKTACPQSISDCVKAKNLHDLPDVCRGEGIPDDVVQKICTLLGNRGRYMAQLTALRALFPGKCDAAAAELEELIKGLEKAGYGDIFNIDFSVINDIAYYNGVVFHGYLDKFPRVVLTGGRYDNLVNKFCAGAGGIGFALYPDELSYYYKKTPGYDADILILYGDMAPADVLTKVKEFTLQGKTVRAATSMPEGRFKEIINLQE